MYSDGDVECIALIIRLMNESLMVATNHAVGSIGQIAEYVHSPWIGVGSDVAIRVSQCYGRVGHDAAIAVSDPSGNATQR